LAIYQESRLGTNTNFITFNKYTGSPVFRVISRAPQRRDLRELDLPVPFESGISDFETLIGKTVYIIDGIMYPGGESDYDLGLNQLRKLASLEIEQNDPLSDEGYVPYVWEEFNRSRQIFMKVLYVQIPETTRKGLVQPFRLICKIKDPTIFGSVLKLASTAPAAFSTAQGTALFSFQFPIIYGASTSSVSVDATNEGDLPVYPVAIRAYGPVNSPRITNISTGEYIEVSGANLATNANVLSIAYDKDSLRVEVDGVTRINSVTNASTYFKLRPGNNVIQLTGSSISDTAYCEITYYSGWPL